MSKSTETEVATMKVVINACYGGFNLSDDAKREYLRRTDREWTEETPFGPSLTIFSVVGDEDWYDRDIPRTDPDLVGIIEEWGERANGSCAQLEIREIPKGTLYRINEYDGFEGIETRDGVEWSVA